MGDLEGKAIMEFQRQADLENDVELLMLEL